MCYLNLDKLAIKNKIANMAQFFVTTIFFSLSPCSGSELFLCLKLVLGDWEQNGLGLETTG